MLPVESSRALVVAVLAVVLSACAVRPPVAPTSDNRAADAEPADDRPQQASPVPPCAWSQIRGIATLLATSNRAPDGIPSTGTWEFFPGEDILFHPVPTDVGIDTGVEYKALLKRPMSAPCKHPQLFLVAPI